MNTEQKDLSLTDEDAENVVGGKAVRKKSQKSHPGYVPGDTGVVEPAVERDGGRPREHRRRLLRPVERVRGVAGPPHAAFFALTPGVKAP